MSGHGRPHLCLRLIGRDKRLAYRAVWPRKRGVLDRQRRHSCRFQLFNTADDIQRISVAMIRVDEQREL